MKLARTTDMTEGASLCLMVKFAVPVLIGSAFQQIYSLADTVIAGHILGSQAIAAIGATGIFFSLLMSIVRGLNIGYGIILSRTFGQGDTGRFRNAVAVMFELNVGMALLLTVLSVMFLRPVLILMKTPPDIFEQSYSYISVILSGLIATVAYNACSGYLNSIGNSRAPLFFLILSSLLNLALDMLFIVVLKIGIAGAAWATVIAQAVSALFSGAYIWDNYRELLPAAKDWKPETPMLKEMLATGLSMALMESAVSLGTVILQRSINALGTAAVTANTASRRIYDLLVLPISALAHGDSVFVSQNYGAKKYRRIRDANRKVLAVILGLSLLAITLSWTVGRQLAIWLIATADEMILSNTVLNMRLNTACFFPLGVLFILRYSMQSMGHKVLPVLSSAIEMAVKVVSAAVLIPSLGYLGVAVTEPAIWCVCAVFLCICYVTIGHQKRPLEQMVSSGKG